MEDVSIEVEAVTPIFIAGADQRNIENEGLRAPSLKGLLRWWFRAIMGEILSVTDLRELESKVFGSTDQKSAVTVRTSVIKALPKQIEEIYSSWRDAIVWSIYVDYFFFSCLDKRRDRKTGKIIVKSLLFYPEGSKFEITLTGREEELKIALSSLWMLIYLGGIGFRLRRGCGSLTVKNIRGTTYDLDFICTDSNKLEEFIRRNMSVIRNYVEKYIIKNKKKISPISISEHTTISPHNSALFIGGEEDSWISALNRIGEWYLGRRRGIKFINGFRIKLADYNFSHNIKNATYDGQYISSENEKRPYLGLPIVYATYKATLTEEKFDRRASPLFFGVYKIGKNYIPRITIYKSIFLPEFAGNFKIEKKIRTNKKERKIILNAKQPNKNSFYGIIKKCYEDLKHSYNWKLIWGEIR